MEKIQQLSRKGKLSQNLMADKDFVDKAKEIFKSENIEIDGRKLAQLMNEIESQLAKSNILNDNALEEVSGGITNKTKRAIITQVTIIAGSAVGTIVGGTVGGFAGEKIGSQVVPVLREAKKQLPLSTKELRGSGIGGQTVGALSMAFVGNYFGATYGEKLGNLI